MNDARAKALRDDRLESWKRIARHLGRSVRTVRRWEKDEALPVHRLAHGGNGSVYAYRGELEQWLADRSLHPVGKKGVNAKQKRLLILPVRDLSIDASQAHLCLGLAEELSSYLMRSAQDALSVIARTSAMSYAGDAMTVGEIGSNLSADFAIEGSLRPQNSHIRVTLNLIRVSNELIVETMEADFPASDPVRFEEDVARGAGTKFLPHLIG